MSYHYTTPVRADYYNHCAPNAQHRKAPHLGVCQVAIFCPPVAHRHSRLRRNPASAVKFFIDSVAVVMLSCVGIILRAILSRGCFGFDALAGIGSAAGRRNGGGGRGPLDSVGSPVGLDHRPGRGQRRVHHHHGPHPGAVPGGSRDNPRPPRDTADPSRHSGVRFRRPAAAGYRRSGC